MPKKQSKKNSPPRKPLSRERILKTALALVDKQGIEALSMRNLAAELSVEAMSLYKHVANKDAVLDGLVEIILREMEIPPIGTPWREAMRRRAWSVRRTIQRHPWASVLIESRTAPSEARLRYADTVLSILNKAGFSPEVQYRAFGMLDSYVYGFELQEVNWPTKESDRLKAVTGVKEFLKDGRFPNLMTVVQDAAWLRLEPGAKPYDAEFEFGLELILDGLERLLQTHANS
ncbi:MAG: TetR/AcrR family transcriptional regulator [Leptospiraceae bacterium]|nr:TetR/AcrR family transcriptional regulator [Leptospiraceae bacterium]